MRFSTIKKRLKSTGLSEKGLKNIHERMLGVADWRSEHTDRGIYEENEWWGQVVREEMSKEKIKAKIRCECY